MPTEISDEERPAEGLHGRASAERAAHLIPHPAHAAFDLIDQALIHNPN